MDDIARLEHASACLGDLRIAVQVAVDVVGREVVDLTAWTGHAHDLWRIAMLGHVDGLEVQGHRLRPVVLDLADHVDEVARRIVTGQ